MTFEEAGRSLDRELTNLRKWAEGKLEPSSRQAMAKALRQAAKRLSKLAERLDAPER